MIKVILVILFLVMVSQSATGQPMREKVKGVYLSQVGIREATGKNDGEQVEKYLRSVGLSKGYPWCAAFVNYCLTETGAKTCKSAWVPSWFPPHRIVYRQGRELQRVPLRGDTFGIWFTKMRRLAHIGFVHTWGDGKYVTTIEGNTGPDGGRDGDGVYRKYRLKSQVHSVSTWLE